MTTLDPARCADLEAALARIAALEADVIRLTETARAACENWMSACKQRDEARAEVAKCHDLGRSRDGFGGKPPDANRPSIAELQRGFSSLNVDLLLAELPHDMRDAGYKDEVADAVASLVNAAPVLLEIASAALAYRDAPEASDAVYVGWVRLQAALAKVAP